MGDSSQTSASAQASSAPPSQPPQTNYGGMALTAAGGFTSAYASLQAAKYNASADRFGARQAGIQAEQALQAGGTAANRLEGRSRAIQGQARGAMAGGGTVAGAGTGAAVLASTEAAAGMDEATIRTNAMREAYGFKAREVALQEAARMEETKGRQQAIATGINTLSQEQLEADPNYAGFRGRGVSF